MKINLSKDSKRVIWHYCGLELDSELKKLDFEHLIVSENRIERDMEQVANWIHQILGYFPVKRDKLLYDRTN